MKVEDVEVGALIPYAGNARTHQSWQIAQIAASIQEFGFTNPILLGADGVIIAGHGRLLAAKKLGLERVPAIRLDHLTPVQQRALAICKNMIAAVARSDGQLLQRAPEME